MVINDIEFLRRVVHVLDFTVLTIEGRSNLCEGDTPGGGPGGGGGHRGVHHHLPLPLHPQQVWVVTFLKSPQFMFKFSVFTL